MITEEQLKEWDEIEKKAPNGPWEEFIPICCPDLGWVEPIIKTSGDVGHVGAIDRWSAEFIAMARTALPLLIEEVKALKIEVQEAEKILDSVRPMRIKND